MDGTSTNSNHTATRADRASGHDPVVGWLVVASLVAAIVWVGGFGSVLAVVLATVGLRNRNATRAERRLLRVAMALGVIGLLASSALIGLLWSSATSPST